MYIDCKDGLKIVYHSNSPYIFFIPNPLDCCHGNRGLLDLRTRFAVSIFRLLRLIIPATLRSIYILKFSLHYRVLIGKHEYF